jgi:uncharacterized caspase-like protein
MSPRALVIGVEHYPRLQPALAGSRDVPGAVHDALAVYDSLLNTLKLRPQDVSLHLSPRDRPPQEAHPAARAADFATVQRAVGDLREQGGLEPPAQVFVYYSGHGFQVGDGGTTLENDALLCADFENLQRNAYTAFKVGELQAVLRGMGPGQHYFFLDCCRNQVTAEQLVIGTLGINFPRSPRGEAAQFTLYATDAQRVAFANAAGTAFTRALVDGLRGRGRSVKWLPDPEAGPDRERLVVDFSTLQAYVQSRLEGEGQRPAPRLYGDPSLAVLRTVYPPPPEPEVQCRLQVDGVPADVTLLGRLTTGHRPPVSVPLPGGRSGTVKLPPDDYTVEVTGAEYTVTPAWQRVALYDDQEVSFRAQRRLAAEGVPRSVTEPAEVTLTFPRGAAAAWEVRDEAGKVRAALPPGPRPGLATLRLAPGRYQARALEQGKPVFAAAFEVVAGESASVPCAPPLPDDPALRALMQAAGEEGGWARPAEDWGPIADRGLGLWLSLLAAAAYWPEGNRLAALLGPRKDQALPGGGALLLLLAVGQAEAPAARYWPDPPSGGEVVLPLRAVHANLPGLWLAECGAHPGPGLVGWETQRGRHSLAVHALADRATCVVVVDRPPEPPAVRAYWLPLPQRAEQLPPEERPGVYKAREVVRWLETAQDRLAAGLALDTPPSPAPGPLGDLLLAYARLRAGDTAGAEPAVRRLASSFPRLADIAALAKLMGRPGGPARGVPLVREGLLALAPEGPGAGYPPASRLNWAGLWSSWLDWPQRPSPGGSRDSSDPVLAERLIMSRFQHGHALVIGVADYQDPGLKLRVPITLADARGVADALRNPKVAAYPDGQVKLLLDAQATRAGVLAALEGFAQAVRSEDTAFLFFCGHGVLGEDGLYYFTTHDTVLTAGQKARKETGVSAPQLLDLLRQVKAQRLVFLINACFSGHLSPTLGPADVLGAPPSATLGVEVLGTGEGRVLITASRPSQYSFYREDQPHSYFGQALIDGLSGKGVPDSGGYVGLYELYLYLHQSVKAAAGGAQEPVLNIVQGVGPFPVALHSGGAGGTLNPSAIRQTPPPATAVEIIEPAVVNLTFYVTQNFAGLLRPVPANYRAAVLRMLEDYRVVFGGRTTELAALDAFLEQSERRCALLLAPTGRGKTALLIRWLSRVQACGGWTIVFAPISRRYQTATADATLGALAHALAEFHKGNLEGQATSPDQLRPLVADYLRREPTEGRRLLLILDGVDEAVGWKLSRDLFPREISAQTRIIAAARQMANKVRADWLEELGWDPRRTLDLTLPRLDRQDVADILRRMGNPLNALASDVDLIAEITRVSQGDPLAIRLLVLALQDGSLSPGRLTRLPEGLESYLRIWLDELGQHSAQTEAVYRLLGLCATALGPLTADDLLELGADCFRQTVKLRQAIGQVDRFIIGDGSAASGYVFSHPGLQELFAEKLLHQRERDEFQGRFVDYLSVRLRM